jgi:very-short-patch-repair endonuclease
MPTSPIALAVWGPVAVRGRGDGEIARIAELQRGIIHRRQLLEADLTAAQIKHRLATGRLHRLYARVYVVGRPRLEPLAAATAAVMHFEGHALLSVRSAGCLWEQIDGPELPVEVTVVGVDARSRQSLVVHRVRKLSQADVRLWKGLPVTSPARTLVDLAGILDMAELEAAYAMTLRRKLVTLDEISDAIARAPGRKGVGMLKALVDDGAQPTLTRSKYERKLRTLIREADLPQPLVNTKVERHEVDFFWPKHRLVVEFDGFGTHGHRTSFETDRLRDQRLIAAGYRVLRITARQIDFTPYAVIARLAAAIAVAITPPIAVTAA